jgi:hypothetical protein
MISYPEVAHWTYSRLVADMTLQWLPNGVRLAT